MKLVTSASIISDVERRLNLTFDGKTKPITLSDVRAEICESVEDLCALVRDADFGDDYLLQTELVSLAAGVSSYDFVNLQHPVMDIKKVAWLKEATFSVPLRRAGVDDWYRYGITAKSWSSSTPTYRMVGNKIEFYPIPETGVQIILSYVGSLNTSTTTNWEVYMANGWRKWIVADVCRKVSIAENKPDRMSQFTSEREDAWNSICMSNADRDEWHPLSVRDIADGSNFTITDDFTYYRRGL